MADGSTAMRSSGAQTESQRNGNEETSLDPIRTGFEIHRGPAQYTHATLPFVYEQEVTSTTATWDYAFRMTSPYDPFVGKAGTDMNVGAGVSSADNVQNEATDPYNKQGWQTAWYRFYAQMYRYYSVLACRYKVTIENLSHEPFLVHQMYVNDNNPPIQASNHDMMIWQGVNTHYITPHGVWLGGGSINQNEVTGDNFDDDTMDPITLNSSGALAAIQNKNGSSISVFAGEYRPGQYDHEIHLDEAVSTWTRTNANPTLREALFLRVKPRDSATAPAAGNASTYGRPLTWNIRVEIEYLCEFKELDSRLRWPVNRNPLGIAINDDPAAVPSAT